ncbi:MAG: hypothetical protein E7042_06365 [Lentisphaerae bacterium]|nr:hypothetical protein [Lentisphaerota bacterium]
MKKFLWFALLLCGIALFAEAPADAVIFEAESFKVTGSWVVKPHFPNWYSDCPSGGKFLSGHTKKSGIARKSVKIAARGKYKLHWRYLDVLNYPAPYKVTISMNGSTLAEAIYNAKSQRASAAAQKKYGKGFAKFMWEKLEFEAPNAGVIEITLTKLPGKTLTAQGTRHLDLFLLTSDLAYQPTILDLNPLYVQIRMLPGQPRPVGIHIFGRLSRAPHYPPHMNINKKGLFVGAYKGLDGKQKDWLGSGDASPWVKLSTHLTFQGTDRISFDARTGYRKAEKNADFEVIFSRTPDERNIIKRFKRSGKGSGILININLCKGTVSSDIEESARTLAYARKTVDVPGGKRPGTFPFITGLRISPGQVDSKIVANESEVMKTLGINGVNGSMIYAANAAADFPEYSLTAFFFHLKDSKCFARPKLKQISALMKEQADTVAKLKRQPLFVNLMDEPDFPAEHVTKCAHCQKAFEAYLAENNAGVSGKLTLNKKDGALYYWTVRFRNNLMTEFFKTATDALAKFDPDIRTTANFAPDVTGGTSIGRGCDWFEIFNSGALTYGWHEDWANLSGTYQCVGFQNAVMRAACREKGLTYGIYNILCRHPWEVEAKGFSAIGYGNSAMHFFNYGPHYANATDTNSQRPEIYQAIKNVTFASGRVENTLTAARPVRGDAAMLMSNTSDIWNRATDNMFGKERVFLHLLLRHCNYSTDVLSENDLAAQLENYKLLFVVDSHIRRSQLKYILDWVKKGNTLYLGAGALMYDENNQPLNSGIARPDFRKLHKVSRGHDGFVKFSKKNKKFQGMTVIGGEELPQNSIKTLGKGRIICSGFFPGLSYMHDSKRSNPEIYSIRNYPAAHRKYIASLKLPLPKVECSDHLVEAHLLESPDKYLIVLANWAGEKRTVNVKFNGKIYTRTIGGGDFIEINK